ncbi:putative Xaa-Pro dipeptidase [Martiniozyma asiatica (nom. inval.)]|nr:putative Xaa-Pro dipeptidase [Martiniozyma asiatica]
MKLYPAKQHAATVAANFIAKKTGTIPSQPWLPLALQNPVSLLSHEQVNLSAFLIAGATPVPFPYCDQAHPLRQNRYFHYLTGVNQIAGCFVLYELSKSKLTLFLPDVDEEDIMWSGLPLSIEQAKENFDVDDVKFAADLPKVLDLLVSENVSIYTTDTEEYKEKPFAKIVKAADPDFFYALDEARLIKDEFELSLMRKAAEITDLCHYKTMSSMSIASNETHLHAEFVYHALREGSKFQSYDPICCSGTNCGTLHYVKNDESFEDSTRQSVLIDAGSEWECYASDVTRCFPISGSWGKEHRAIYESVLDMQTQVMAEIKAGAHWDDLHKLSHRVLIDNFIKLGLFVGDAQEIFDSRVSVWFYPHGLGHLLGMDTHDVGGYANYEDSDAMLRYLRLRRPLVKGMVLTNEPGIYFSPFLLEKATPEQRKFVNWELVEKYMPVGGVRIEDDILVLEGTCEIFTKIAKDADKVAEIVQNGLKN